MIKDKFFNRSALVGVLVILITGLALEACFFLQSYSYQEGLRNEATLRAEGELKNSRNQIMDVLDQGESAVRNKLGLARWCISNPDSLGSALRRVIMDNPSVDRTVLAFVPDPLKGRHLLAGYCSGDMKTGRLDYDYTSGDWFVKGLVSDSGYWSDPYKDEEGKLMVSFSMPVKDASGKVAAILRSDISLDWLGDLFGDVPGYKNAFSGIVTRDGLIMESPVEEYTMEKTIHEVTESFEHSDDMTELIESMLAGEEGEWMITRNKVKEYVYYAPVERTGWSMSIVIPEDEIFSVMKKLSRRQRLLELLSLLLLAVIFIIVAKSWNNFRSLFEKEEKMDNELRIASGIQRSMIPEAFPPLSEREDIDMSASLVPAKQVGGDLYDFFIRDEKLFFCIGDVSGKGVPASLVMAVTRSLFRAMSLHEDSPRRIVTLMNAGMCDMNENNMFVTFFCGVLDIATGGLKYCNAGHNAPVLLSEVNAKLDVSSNLPLGVMPDKNFDEQEVVLFYDDALFLYTDGLTEAENKTHDLFGEERMMEVLSTRREDAKSSLQAMEKAVSDFVDDAPKSDDMTMLLIHYTNKAMKEGMTRDKIVLKSNISNIPELSLFLEGILEKKNVESGLAVAINLAVEEAVTNVMMYAYPEGTEGDCEVEVISHEGAMEIIVTDNGRPFDPTKVPKVDTSARLEDRKIGGLGVHLVRNIMDSVSYKRSEGKNVFSMIKKI